ncbi:MAG: hypothetical protein MSA05_07290 [Prevotella sp.]|uniref:hypothetical protein n=1 Tax=uncultured Prevotella sp. TaxID=159272 RepID=UPI0025E62D01|nr:hypothetical protein [Prevotella sp.]MCI7183949.1 hypothetical protein [Prevotella sp.]
MKKIFTMIIALALVPAFAAAQTTIARVVEQFKKGAVEEISTSKETDTDTDGKQCVYERNIFLVAKNSGKFKQLMDVFNDEQTNAYSVNKRMAGYDGSASKIGYGKNSEKTIVFMKYSDRNYFVLYFKDPADSKRRTCYALAWYESKKDKKKKEMWCVDIIRVYSLNPEYVRSLPKTITKTTTTVNSDDTNTSITVNSDGTIIRYDRNTGNSIVYRPQDNKKASSIDVPIKNSGDFIQRFNDLRTEYIQVVQFAGKEQTFFANRIMPPVNKMLQLCREHGKLLLHNERLSCIGILDDMKQNARDKGIREMLNLAQTYLGGK